MNSTNPLATAAARFGLGPDLSGDWSGPDARARVEAQIGVSPATGLSDRLLSGQENVRRWRTLREAARQQKAQTEAANRAMAGGGAEVAPAVAAPAPAAMAVMENGAPVRWIKSGDEFRVRVQRALAHKEALPERLVLFWSDYFTVAQSGKSVLAPLVGPFEREALRPHVFAPFRVLLSKVVTHPAMLIYLDNDRSFGPNSRTGLKGGHGLNENLAREILELHTLGSQGGYTQTDVTAFAAVLSGWSMVTNFKRDTYGACAFEPAHHEPGPKTVLGKTYPDVGGEQLQLVLDDLARHPATARHVSTRMCRAFLSEEPPPQLVARMAQAFQRTDGDLGEVVRVMVRSDEAWSLPPRKVRSPMELVYVVARLLNAVPNQPPVEQALAAMGQPYFSAPSPKGWPDEDNAWATADGIKTRLDWARSVAGAFHAAIDIRQIADGPLRGVLSDETRTTLLQAESQEQALTLLIMSPELQRR
ncbi:DUF1800 domain-containing protein [Xanthobacter sp. V4C-4]|uniref:DUF1800 domain-containing protein n=1 Tax=Xanthobacter cornucopiae TaxID=3119924 RepID=UPI00372AE3B1